MERLNSLEEILYYEAGKRNIPLTQLNEVITGSNRGEIHLPGHVLSNYKDGTYRIYNAHDDSKTKDYESREEFFNDTFSLIEELYQSKIEKIIKDIEPSIKILEESLNNLKNNNLDEESLENLRKYISKLSLNDELFK